MFKYQAFLRSVFCSEFRSRGVGCLFFSLSPPFFSPCSVQDLAKIGRESQLYAEGNQPAFFRPEFFNNLIRGFLSFSPFCMNPVCNCHFFSSITLYKRERKEYVEYVSKAIKLFLFSEWLNQEFMFLVNHLHFYSKATNKSTFLFFVELADNDREEAIVAFSGSLGAPPPVDQSRRRELVPHPKLEIDFLLI